MKEFELINKYLNKRAGKRKDVIQGIGDDCAVLQVATNCELVISTDSIIAGVHFLADAPAYDIGYQALAVNLSDLAAMGAKPCWATLALTLPKINESWLNAFCDGFFSLLEQYSMQLIGGDTTRGPLAITVHVYGFIPPGKALFRSGAKTGDFIYVTGNLGAGLSQRPIPRIQEGLVLRDIATSAIDISDGLAADLGHILQQSNAGATINIDDIPISDELKKAVGKDKAQQLALAAGDDYELCFTVPKDKEFKLKCTKIGVIEQQPGLRIQDQKGNLIKLKQKGYEHNWREI